jgi:hypothetical protein
MDGRGLQDERGKLLFSTECKLLKFAIQVKAALRYLLEEHGVEGYKRQWVTYDFPMEVLEDLAVPYHLGGSGLLKRALDDAGM